MLLENDVPLLAGDHGAAPLPFDGGVGIHPKTREMALQLEPAPNASLYRAPLVTLRLLRHEISPSCPLTPPTRRPHI